MAGVPRVITVSGASGVGKDSLVEPLMSFLRSIGIGLARGITTRGRRPSDSSYLDFVTDEEFDRLIEAGELAEWDDVAGERYGTRKDAIESAGQRGAIKIVTVAGARAIRRAMVEDHGEEGANRHLPIYVTAPQGDVLRRLREDRGWDETKIRSRMTSQEDGFGVDHTDGSDFWRVNISNGDGRLDTATSELLRAVRDFVLCANDWPLDRGKVDRARLVAHAFGGAYPDIRDEEALRDCLVRHVGVGTEDWSAPERAEVMLRAFIGKHPLVDCNKRTAVVVVEEYLLHSGHLWLADPMGKVRDVIGVARDPWGHDLDLNVVNANLSEQVHWNSICSADDLDMDWVDTLLVASRLTETLRALVQFDVSGRVP